MKSSVSWPSEIYPRNARLVLNLQITEGNSPHKQTKKENHMIISIHTNDKIQHSLVLKTSSKWECLELVFCWCVVNYHKLRDLKCHPLITQHSVDQKSEWAGIDSLLRISHSRYWLGWVLFWKLWGRIYFQAYSGCWQTSGLGFRL